MLFKYSAYAQTGREINGVIDADSIEEAKKRLHEQKMLIKKLSISQKDKKEIALGGPLLLAFTRDLSQLLLAGLPLYECLLTIEEKHRRHKAHPLFLDLCDSLKNGNSLSSALRNYPKSFSDIYISMVQAAEESGAIESIFNQLALLTERQQKLKKQLVSAMIYPLFLGSFCLIVISALLFFVIPSMQELFEGRSLHPMTAMVLGLSNWLKSNIASLLISVGAIIGSAIFYFRKPAGKALWQKILLKVPFFKTVLIQSALIRFCRALSVLLIGGVPLLEALQLAKKVIRLHVFEKLIHRCEEALIEGKPFSDELFSCAAMPTMVARMVKTAEATGKLDQMMRNIAEIYEDETEKNLQQITALLQPMLLVFLGGVVGVILLAVLLPLTDVSSFL